EEERTLEKLDKQVLVMTENDPMPLIGPQSQRDRRQLVQEVHDQAKEKDEADQSCGTDAGPAATNPGEQSGHHDGQREDAEGQREPEEDHRVGYPPAIRIDDKWYVAAYAVQVHPIRVHEKHRLNDVVADVVPVHRETAEAEHHVEREELARE